VDDHDLRCSAVVANSAAPVLLPHAPSIGTDFFGFFIQDDWRIRPTLTLNLGFAMGVRYGHFRDRQWPTQTLSDASLHCAHQPLHLAQEKPHWPDETFTRIEERLGPRLGLCLGPIQDR